MTYKTAYIRTVLVMLALTAAYTFYDINQAYQALEADGNQFAGLVWNALPTRLITDGTFTAIIALGVAWIYMKWTNRHQPDKWAAPNPRTKVGS